ncbi:hypothetical protein ATK30_0813 [Amycolatopsis echigonensis]|uniref:Uncharacterized protein n=1 Tax=Amycolatopsis echigonensis TaxID=2576905 RepID=A0A2N3X128_9PSEU|nr:hypothetical protein ATK30_0813 [Amycolatopsis niigatensis]
MIEEGWTLSPATTVTGAGRGGSVGASRDAVLALLTGVPANDESRLPRAGSRDGAPVRSCRYHLLTCSLVLRSGKRVRAVGAASHSGGGGDRSRAPTRRAVRARSPLTAWDSGSRRDDASSPRWRRVGAGPGGRSCGGRGRVAEEPKLAATIASNSARTHAGSAQIRSAKRAGPTSRGHARSLPAVRAMLVPSISITPQLCVHQVLTDTFLIVSTVDYVKAPLEVPWFGECRVRVRSTRGVRGRPARDQY